MTTQLDLGDRFSAEFDRIDQVTWNAELQAFADASFYQTWAYAVARCGEGRVGRMVLRRNGKIVALAQTRLHTTPVVPLGVAYVHWGPVWRRIGEEHDVRVFEKALAGLHAEYSVRRRLSLRVLPPVYDCEPYAADVFQHLAQSRFTKSNMPARLLLVNVRPDSDDLRKGLDKKWRNQLAAAEKAGVVVTESCDPCGYETYAGIHRQMRSRKKLTADDGLGYVLRACGDESANPAARVLLAMKEGRPVAGAVLSTIGKRGIYMFGATTEAGMRVKASNMVQWHAMHLLKKLHVDEYDLSGISPETNPGTYHFKAGLCGTNGVETSMRSFINIPNFWTGSVIPAALVQSILCR
jgi:hypothetical protein